MTISDITIQQATLKDCHAVAELFNQYRIFYQQESDLELAREFIEARITASESVIFYARNNNDDYLGFTQLYPSFSSVSAKRIWILNDLYVDDKARRLGVGRQLLNHAKAFAQDTQAKGIGLQTAKTNRQAQALYESLSYQRDEEFYSYFLTI